VGFRHDGLALMRETPEQALRDGLVRQTCCYPLIPYSNRIAQGRFSFEGFEHRLALNFGDHPHSIHGNAWQRPWQVVEADEARCRLALTHRPDGDEAGGWPYAYRAEQLFELSPDGLMLTLSLKNEDLRAMPAGLGLHPFFPKHPGVRLQFAAERVYPNGEDSLPMDGIPVPDDWSYRTMRELGEPRLDNCFAGWDGTAGIAYDQEKIALSIEADPLFGHLVVYVPTGRDFFAVEPVSHMNDAISRPDPSRHGLKVLRSGERLTARVRFGVEALS
jgi:aldose 1-epimerase